MESSIDRDKRECIKVKYFMNPDNLATKYSRHFSIWRLDVLKSQSSGWFSTVRLKIAFSLMTALTKSRQSGHCWRNSYCILFKSPRGSVKYIHHIYIIVLSLIPIFTWSRFTQEFTWDLIPGARVLHFES